MHELRSRHFPGCGGAQLVRELPRRFLRHDGGGVSFLLFSMLGGSVQHRWFDLVNQLLNLPAWDVRCFGFSIVLDVLGWVLFFTYGVIKLWRVQCRGVLSKLGRHELHELPRRVLHASDVHGVLLWECTEPSNVVLILRGWLLRERIRVNGLLAVFFWTLRGLVGRGKLLSVRGGHFCRSNDHVLQRRSPSAGSSKSRYCVHFVLCGLLQRKFRLLVVHRLRGRDVFDCVRCVVVGSLLELRCGLVFFPWVVLVFALWNWSLQP